MFKHIVKIMAFLFCGYAMADGLPRNTEVTPENAESLSIQLKKIDSGSAENYLYLLEFSDKLGNCMAGRVQTSLMLAKNEISGSSMDYQVGSSKPTVLLHMPASGYDMAVTLQYCCSTGLYPGCEKSISISSVKSFAPQ
ncbi:hypothetical protein ACJJIL_15155 [Microbulbifer sp. EKSA005]|uniref:hypothetical protein n=1 Tax=Microbulbifer sp. EKSA005 TaxID=3243364 RepID=UPI0040429F0D